MLPKPPSPIFLTLSVGYFRVDHASQTPALFFLLRHLYCWSDAASASQEMYPRPDSCILRPYGGLGFGGLGLGLSALSGLGLRLRVLRFVALKAGCGTIFRAIRGPEF